jgi:predicted RNA-binding protein with PUA domain
MKTEDYTPKNREKSRTAKKAWFWCGSCDCQLVSQSEKCLNCGKRENRKKIRIKPV